MALLARKQHQNCNFYQEISSLDESVVKDAIRSFTQMKASGRLTADSFESKQWIMTDGVRRAVMLDFQIDEVAFSRNGNQLLECTLRDYEYAMRVAI